MKKILPLLSLLLVVSACGQPNTEVLSLDNQVSTLNKSSNKKAANEFTVTTYDIKSFFTKKAKDATLETNLSNAIHSLNSDLISFQDISSIPEFKTFTEKYLKDMNYKFYSSQDAGSKVGSVVLSKFNASVKKPSTADKYPSNTLFKLNVNVNPNYDFAFYTTFVPPANATGYSQTKRNAEIEEMKAYVGAKQKANFKENYLIVGNLNGSPTQADLETIIDPRASLLSFHDIVTEDLGNEKTIFSKEVNKVKSRPDYILVSPNMFNVYIYNSVTIANKASDKAFKGISDHYPVTATFTIPSR